MMDQIGKRLWRNAYVFEGCNRFKSIFICINWYRFIFKIHALNGLWSFLVDVWSFNPIRLVWPDSHNGIWQTKSDTSDGSYAVIGIKCNYFK